MRPVEIEELIKRDMKHSLGDSAATTDIRGQLGVVPDIQGLIESIDELIDTAYAMGLKDGVGKKEIHDGNTISGEWT